MAKKETAAERAERERLEPPADWQDQSVLSALVRVMRDVQEVGKDRRNEESPDQFMFRGLDAVVNAVGPILRKHGVLCVPTLRKVTIRTARVGQQEAVAAFVTVRYTFWGPDGSSLPVQVPGEAMDFGDKAVNKAMSVAWRTALLHALQIPTGERDPDSYSYQRSGGQPAAQGQRRPPQSGGGRQGQERPYGDKEDSRQPLWDEIREIGAAMDLNIAKVRSDFFRWSQGKQIDGARTSPELLMRYRDDLAHRRDNPEPPAAEGDPTPDSDAEAHAQRMLEEQLGAEPVTSEGGGE